MRYFIVFLILLSACSSNNSTTQKEESVSAVTVSSDSVKKNLPPLSAPVSFIDSVRRRLPIPISQLCQRTLIESFYYTGFNSDATFEGDTVVNFSNGYLGAILNYNDGKVCSKKLLFIFDSTGKKNTSYEMIALDCDHFDDEYINQVYVLSDTMLETRKSIYPFTDNSSDSIPKSTEIVRWKVNSKGILDSTGLN